MNVSPLYPLIFSFCFLSLCILFFILFPIKIKTSHKIKNAEDKDKGNEFKGLCPICSHPLKKGEKVRSNQVEIGGLEVQTRIKGCIYCFSSDAKGLKNKRRRICPICKKNIDRDGVILAIADPRVSRLQLKIQGCRACFPQGFL